MVPLSPKSELLLGQEMEQAQTHALGPGTAAVFSTRSPLKEDNVPNEDAAALVPVDDGRCVLAVADGVGGQPGGDLAARLALEAVIEALEQNAPETPLREAILDGFERANESIRASRPGAATTLVVAEIDGPTVRSYHVGDSGLLVIGQRGRIKLQTVFHSPVGYAVEAGYLDEHEAIHHEDRHLISNALGTENMRVELGSSFDLSPRDTLVLASDGLFDNLKTKEIAERIRKGELGSALDVLASACRGRMLSEREGVPSKPDDLTVIAYRRRDSAADGPGAGTANGAGRGS